MSRYKVTQLPDQSRWVILDKELYGYCTLPDGNGNLLPLEWKGEPAAEAWLQSCFRIWSNGIVPAPAGWQPHTAQVSPWDPSWSDAQHDEM